MVASYGKCFAVCEVRGGERSGLVCWYGGVLIYWCDGVLLWYAGVVCWSGGMLVWWFADVLVWWCALVVVCWCGVVVLRNAVTDGHCEIKSKFTAVRRHTPMTPIIPTLCN